LCNAANHPNGCECGFGPPYNRNVPELFDNLVGNEGGKDLSLAGPRSEVLGSLLENKQLTTQLVSTFFWQSYVGRSSTELIRTVRTTEASKEAPIVYIVRHGVGQSRHDLLIFDPHLSSDEVKHGSVEVSPADLRAGWQNFRNAYDLTDKSAPQWLSGFNLLDVPEIAVEAMSTQRYFFIAMHPPKIVWTSGGVESFPQIPSGALAVSKKAQSKKLSTAGVVSSDEQGRTGVTTALHSFKKHGTTVFVEGIQGTVRAKDLITDSCFIELNHSQLPPFGKCNGPLTGVTPGRGESVWFTGIAQDGKVETHVEGWTPELPWYIPDVQARIITPPVTNPGDSGAALMNQKGHVIGFAYYRTGFNAKSPHSAWIWAESVFSALHLK
jgi:hypothetical protein